MKNGKVPTLEQKNYESSRIKPGQLARGQESDGLPHDREQDVPEESWKQAETEDDLKRAIGWKGRLYRNYDVQATVR